MSRHTLAAVLAVLTAAAAPSTASGAVGATEVTSPADGTELLAGDTAQTVTIEGEAPGASDTDLVDLYCLRFSESIQSVETEVAITGEAFSVEVETNDFPAGTCRLLAIPAGSSAPTTESPDRQGPLVTGTYRLTYTTEGTAVGSPNVLYDYFISHQQTRGYGDYDSISSCGLCDTMLHFADSGHSSNFVHYANGFLDTDLDAPLNRAGARVDGHNSWGSAVAQMDVGAGGPYVPANSLEGVPPLTFTTTGGRNEDFEILEEQDLVRCQDGDPFPVDAGDCGRFVPTGVRVFRRILQTRDGMLFLFTDVFRSTDGAAHELDLLWGQDFRDPSSGAEEPAFQFPWNGDAYSTHEPGDIVPGTSQSPAVMFVKSNATKADGDELWPQGLVMYDRPITGDIRFTDVEDFVTPTTLSVPAGGEATFRHAYAIAATRQELVDFASQVEDLWVPPAVEITAPAEGATVSTAEVDVTGRATDNKGTPTLTLNGQAVTVGGDGGWARRVTLQPGPNTLTAVARDAQSNEVTATRQVTYTPPPPLPPPLDTVAPGLTSVSMTNSVFAVAAGRTAVTAAAKLGTRVRYTLNEAATVTFAIARARPGRRVGGRCRKVTRANRGRRRCTRFVRAGRTISRASQAGPSTLRFTGRIGRRALRRGRYRMGIRATDAAGNRSAARRLRFRIVRRT